VGSLLVAEPKHAKAAVMEVVRCQIHVVLVLVSYVAGAVKVAGSAAVVAGPAPFVVVAPTAALAPAHVIVEESSDATKVVEEEAEVVSSPMLRTRDKSVQGGIEAAALNLTLAILLMAQAVAWVARVL
jgi:hypothetical protein